MNSEKYIGLDVHQATISVAVLDSRGKLVSDGVHPGDQSSARGQVSGVAIRGRTLCSNMGTKVTASMPASSPSC
jgi:hypothetical protein